jgi:hypothetical protein
MCGGLLFNSHTPSRHDIEVRLKFNFYTQGLSPYVGSIQRTISKATETETFMRSKTVLEIWDFGANASEVIE